MRGHKFLDAAEPDKALVAPVKRSVLDLVGNTPLVRINNITRDLPLGVIAGVKKAGYWDGVGGAVVRIKPN